MHRLSAALPISGSESPEPPIFDHLEVLNSISDPSSPSSSALSPSSPSHTRHLYTRGRQFRVGGGSSFGVSLDIHEVRPLSSLRLRYGREGDQDFDIFFDGFDDSDEQLQPSSDPGSDPTIPISSSSSNSVTSFTSSVSMDWLRLICSDIFQSPQVAETVIRSLEEGKTTQTHQDSLVGIFGYDHLDLITRILQNRKTLLLCWYEEEQRKRTGKVTGLGKAQFLSSIQIIDQRQIDLKKKIRNLTRSITRRRDMTRKQKKIEENQAKTLELLKNELDQIERDEARQAGSGAGGGGSGSGTGGSSAVIRALQEHYPDLDFSQAQDLKAKAIKKDNYMEFVVEPRRRPEGEVLDLIPVVSMPQWTRRAFSGFKELNPIQSKTFHVAFETAHNMLICAPTGCGKTNVAMMAILHTIGRHSSDGVIHREEFKILYVSPMKALAGEIVSKFSTRLAYLGIRVREYTGDMRLSRAQLQDTQVIVTTPEKWDVVTRRQSDLALIDSVRLIIIDEIHLLNEDRGPVIECIVARTLQYIESSQRPVRLVGLSATLPNYEDVASFLRVNHMKGLFHFDNSFRPVPLVQKFIGVDRELEDEVCFDKVKESIEAGHQVMVFVHSRRGTVKCCRDMLEFSKGQAPGLFTSGLRRLPNEFQMRLRHSRNRELVELMEHRVVFHHAGVLRRDRNLVEDLFRKGHVKLLCCTSTLAWGVNLPAHTVIIKGTSIYSAEVSSFIELGILDVMQIFGRAGRPQYDQTGEGVIITKLQQAPRYLALLNNAVPIESKLHEYLEDHLNAEVARGSVTSVREGIRWLTYTYLYIRIRKNPMQYGVKYKQLQLDRNMALFRRALIEEAAIVLDGAKMVRYSKSSHTISPTHLGRTGSHYYIRYETMDLFNRHLRTNIEEAELLRLICSAREFEQIRVRKGDVEELEAMACDKNICPLEIGVPADSTVGKVNVLLQAYISRTFLRNFALCCDTAYVKDNAGRIVRAMLDIVLLKREGELVNHLVLLNKCVEQRAWGFENPLRQFKRLDDRALAILEGRNRRHHEYDVEELEEMDPRDIDHILRSGRGMGHLVKQLIRQIPFVELSWYAQPITRQVLRVEVTIKPSFDWTNKSYHREVEQFWFFILDQATGELFYSEFFSLSRKNRKERTIKCMIPVRDDPPTQKTIRVVSASWFGSCVEEVVDLSEMSLPERFPRTRELLKLRPLRVEDVIDESFRNAFSFDYFNAIQTQVFHSVYHSDQNILIGAATGCGKTVIADLAIIRSFKHHPRGKIVYIAPMKALVREKMRECKEKYPNKVVAELTGDFTPDSRALSNAHILITTPEKWDGVTRHWQQRSYVQKVGLLVIDEVHLVGTERGAVLEMIVSRMRFVSWALKKPIRIVALGTSLANSDDASGWLGVDPSGLANYNFKNSVRPVPLTTHIQGFSEKYYCPRMESMNKPCFQSICSHSPGKPVLLFVSSRRQTRLTALSLISQCINQGDPFRFSNMNELEIKRVQSELNDTNVKHTIQYGMGLHHAGLIRSDREIVEYLFRNGKLSILVSTATLAWGVNLPAHLVIIKGTEYYDPKEQGFVQYPVTDILQMMGRAGRPQFDNEGVVSIFVQNSHKDFYKKFLFEPFPVESWLHQNLHNHLNAEIASGVIATRQDAVDYLTWTFLYRRLLKNPSYYDVIFQDEDDEEEEEEEGEDDWDDSYVAPKPKPKPKDFDDTPFDMKVTQWLSERVMEVLEDLMDCGCIGFGDSDEDESSGVDRIQPMMLGHVASFYYVDYRTVDNFSRKVLRAVERSEVSGMKNLLQFVAEATEFDELPVRHNEEILNFKLSEVVPYGSFLNDYEAPSVKAYLLLQAHFTRVDLPIADYITDLRTVLDQTIRILQCYIDISAHHGLLDVTLNLMHILQMMHQARWFNVSSLLCLPHVGPPHVRQLKRASPSIVSLAQLVEASDGDRSRILSRCLGRRDSSSVCSFLKKLPKIRVSVTLADSPRNPEMCQVRVGLFRESRVLKFSHTPMFKKRKEEGWWIVVGNREDNSVYGLSRFRLKKQKHVVLEVEKAHVRSSVLFLMADSYMGLDQEYSLDVVGLDS